MHGVWARHGDRAVQVIRCEEGEWMCFATINDRVCRGDARSNHATKSAGLKWAYAFLRGEITPDVWPDCVRVITGDT